MPHKTIAAVLTIGFAVAGCSASRTASYEMGRSKGQEVPVKHVGSANATQTCQALAQVAVEGSAAGTTEKLPQDFSRDEFVTGCVDVVT